MTSWTVPFRAVASRAGTASLMSKGLERYTILLSTTHACSRALSTTSSRTTSDVRAITLIYWSCSRRLHTTPFHYISLTLAQVTYKTEMGQLVDQITAPEDNLNIDKYTLPKHTFIVRYKTAYYSFYLSVALAMRMCGVPDAYELSGKTVEPYKEADRILIPMGEFFQVQDDYLDYHGTEAQIGKIGTDIIDGKCSWCVCTALTHGTDTQKQFLFENYGKKGPEQTMREQAVKDMYNDEEGLNIPKHYEEYSKNAVEEINAMIELVPEPGVQDELRGDRLRRDVFRAFLSKITDRTA